MSERPYRLAILTTHPIQYNAPLFRRLAADPRLEPTVFYCYGAEPGPGEDPGFGLRFEWDQDLRSGYPHRFFPNLRRREPPRGFFGLINPAICNELRRGRYDALLSFGWAHATHWLAFLAARFTRTPYLLFGDSALLHPRPLGRELLRQFALRWLFAHARAALTPGWMNARFYEHYGLPSQRLYPAPLTVDLDEIDACRARLFPQRAALRRQLGLPQDAIVVLFAGKLIARKRPGDLLQACARLPDSRTVVLMVGEGERAGALHRQAQPLGPRVRFAGFQNLSALPPYYVVADILVLPSEIEPRGLVVVEALAYGLPVVISDRVPLWGPGDIVRDGENGFVYPVGDIAALRERLQRLIEDPARRHQMSERARALIAPYNYGAFVEALCSALAPRPT